MRQSDNSSIRYYRLLPVGCTDLGCELGVGVQEGVTARQQRHAPRRHDQRIGDEPEVAHALHVCAQVQQLREVLRVLGRAEREAERRAAAGLDVGGLGEDLEDGLGGAAGGVLPGRHAEEGAYLGRSVVGDGDGLVLRGAQAGAGAEVERGGVERDGESRVLALRGGGGGDDNKCITWWRGIWVFRQFRMRDGIRLGKETTPPKDKKMLKEGEGKATAYRLMALWGSDGPLGHGGLLIHKLTHPPHQRSGC